MSAPFSCAEEVAPLRALLATCREVVLVGHKNPDGDCLGACLAWAALLRDCYEVSTTILLPDSYPDFLAWLPDSHTIVNYDRKREQAEEALSHADHLFYLDCNAPTRTGGMAETLSALPIPTVLIDHHLDAAAGAALSFVDAGASSTCELVVRLSQALGVFDGLSGRWATLVYCGMMTDTGAFTYNSSRPEIYTIISALLAKGINKDRIYNNVYHNYSSWAVRFRGYIMSQKLNVYEDLHASYFAISNEEMDAYHFVRGDAEGLVNIPLTIKGLRLSISLREDDRQANTVWVSIRTVGDLPAHTLAAEFFHGGGHMNAAGGRVEGTLDDAIALAKRAIKSLAVQLKKSNN